MNGRIHSIESFGTLDGPGIRYVVFLQGCPLRCKYCHNVDTWTMNGGKEVSSDDIIKNLKRYRAFLKNGGLTVTGGEPLLQIEFITELFEKAKAEGFHTCIDTSGATFVKDIPVIKAKFDRLIAVTDLVMLDIKHIDSEKNKALVGLPNTNTLDFLDYLKEQQIKVWLRHVLVPGITDDEESLVRLGKHLSNYDNIEAIGILPFHQKGKYKWEQVGRKYELEGVREATEEDVVRAKAIVMKYFNKEY